MADLDLRLETRPDGAILVWQDAPLGPWPRAATERLLHWAEDRPDATWLAERDGTGGWLRVSYADGARQVQAIASALLARELSVDRPLVILSGNSVAHALMALGAQHAGIPSAAVAPAYTLSGDDRRKLTDVVGQLTPGLVFADHAEAYLPAITAAFATDITLASVTGRATDRETLAFDDLCATPPSDAMRAAHAAITGETVAKFLFTSGTTGSPKAVIQTHGMICSNQAMVAHAYGFSADDPPVLLDWAPWNHTASGNKIFNIALHNGGTYHIDDGRPTPERIARTVANLREVAPTWYFNVPVGFQFLIEAMERDDGLARQVFSRLRMLMYAGAGMSQPMWDRLVALIARHAPHEIPIVSGLGATETGPFALYHADRKAGPGNIGHPARGVTLKLFPNEGRFEARLKSPSITPGYWRDPGLTAQAFDEEGFYRLGDALRFAEPGNPAAGFIFDGRLAENFKLATGTWVSVSALRAQLVNAMGGLVGDAVLVGENRDDLRALFVPVWAELRAVANLPDNLPPSQVLAHPAVRAALADRLSHLARQATGSASRIAAALVIETPLSFDRGEVTDKGSVNQRAVLRERDDLVAALYSDEPRVIRADWKGLKA